MGYAALGSVSRVIPCEPRPRENSLALAMWTRLTPSRHALRAVLPLVVGLGALACGKADPSRNPFDPPPDAPKPAPKITEVPKPKGPPQIVIDEFGPKVGFNTVLIEKKDGLERLKKAVAEVKKDYEGKEVVVAAERKARTIWVSAMVQELAAIGVGDLYIATPTTRPGLPSRIRFFPESRAGRQPGCALVVMILDDFATATWKISGGTAGRRGKGMAGPDLTMTGETIERRAKACDETSTFFVSAAETIEWGLTYDLAATAQKLEKAKLDRPVLLSKIPVAGRPVELK